MSKDQTGGPAFPVCYQHENLETGEKEATAAFHGMTLRDWFAGQALVGFISNPTIGENIDSVETAEMAYGQADAMLVAREERQA